MSSNRDGNEERNSSDLLNRLQDSSNLEDNEILVLLSLVPKSTELNPIELFDVMPWK